MPKPRAIVTAPRRHQTETARHDLCASDDCVAFGFSWLRRARRATEARSPFRQPRAHRRRRRHPLRRRHARPASPRELGRVAMISSSFAPFRTTRTSTDKAFAIIGALFAHRLRTRARSARRAKRSGGSETGERRDRRRVCVRMGARPNRERERSRSAETSTESKCAATTDRAA